MKTLKATPDLFPGLVAYHAYATLALSFIPMALASSAGDGIRKLTLAETSVACGMVRKEEIWSLAGIPVSDEGNPECQMVAYYAADGSYVGDQEVADNLIEKGIVPQRKRSDLNVASLGFCESEQKWWGWSHRAMGKFGVGDKFHHAGQFWEDEGQEFADKVCATLDEAYVSACNFSDDVS